MLTLIKQSNPKLSWQEILKITQQSGFSKYNKNIIPQVHSASILARNGAKVSVQIEGPSDETSKVILLDENRTFTASTMGYVEFYLREGSYRVAYTAKGYAPKIGQINVIAQQNQRLTVKLEKSELLELNINAYDSQNIRIPAIIEFPNGAGQKFIGLTHSLNESLPEGIYPVKILSRGYQGITTSIIHTKSIQSHRFKFDVVPMVAIINQDIKKDIQSPTARSLQQLGIPYDFFRNPKFLEDIEAYQTLIWESGNTLNESVNLKQQLLLTKYLRQGGSVLITGQDLAYWLQKTPFLNKILGVSFEQDHSSNLELESKKLKLQLSDKANAGDQLYVDTLKPLKNDAKCYLNYRNGLCAAVLRYHPKGKSVILGFDLKGLSDAQRKLLLQSSLSDLSPALEHLLDKIENAYLNNRVSYFQMMRSLETFQPKFAQRASQHIERRRNKSAWRPLLHDILHDRRRHIFDQLYSLD